MTTGCRPGVPIADLPDWDPRKHWDAAEEEQPAPDCGHGLWRGDSAWDATDGQPDDNGYLIPPIGTRCVGCGQALTAVPELIAPIACTDGLHYHCGTCAAFLEDDE